jgi:hypothetical protein
MTEHAEQPPAGRPDASATAALRTVRSAQAAARAAQTPPRGYLYAQGFACAVEFAALGLAQRHDEWQGPLLALGLLAFVAFMALMWAGIRHGGSVPWFRREDRPAWRAGVLPAASIGAGALAAVPYGFPGALVVFGLVCALDFWRRAARTEQP